jgi:hypothetical protein
MKQKIMPVKRIVFEGKDVALTRMELEQLMEKISAVESIPHHIPDVEQGPMRGFYRTMYVERCPRSPGLRFQVTDQNGAHNYVTVETRWRYIGKTE